MKRKYFQSGLMFVAIILMLLSMIRGSTQAAQAAGGGTTIGNIIPMPASVTSTGDSFVLPSSAGIYVNPATAENLAIGQALAGKLRPATGYGIPVSGTTSAPANGNIYLKIGTDSTLGTEGYLLTVTAGLVTLEAYQPTGLFRGIQTIRQMLPAGIDSPTLRADTWGMSTGTVRDTPRFAYRSAMLDVGRHFQSVANVKRLIDEMAYYKLSYFHFHLSDDQGWRVVINGYPNLTDYGAQTQVGGTCTNCYYTQAQYTDIVNYAAARYITVVPEFDMPGHINAALASYANLNCSGVAPARRTDTAVGYSSLCTTQPTSAAVTAFMNAVIDQISALTPGPYFHIGGDESAATPLAEYQVFISQAQARIIADGKKMIGWEETANITDLSSTSTVHFWNNAGHAQTAVSKGAKVIMSPCPNAYMDIKYDVNTPLGLSWCGYDSVSNSYSWDPGTYVSGVTDANIAGVEGPLWSETIVTMADIEYMFWPRLAGLAELGWSPTTGRNWSEYKVRLGSQGPRWTLMGINFYADSAVPWWGLGQPTPTPVPTSQYTDVALNKPVTVSSTYSTYSGNLAVDGNSSSKWWSNGVPAQSISVDLGAVYSISSVNLLWGTGDYASAYNIQTKINVGDAWVTQLGVTSGTGGQDNRSFTAVNARYVQLSIISSPATNWIQLFNFEVYGMNISTPTTIPTRSAYTQIEAESYTSQIGTQLEACTDTGAGQNVGYIDAGDYLTFNNIDFGSGASSVQLRLASAATFSGTVELRLGSPTGTLIGTVGTTGTGGWQVWQTSTGSISGASGVQNLYLVFQGGAGIVNINWLKFVSGGAATVTPTPTATTPISGVLSRSGWVATGSSTGAGETPGNAIDGNATTRWSTGAAQVNGQWFQVDMLSAKTFNQITLDSGTSTGDYPRGYQVFVSNDGANWGSAVATGTGATQLITIPFTAQTARFIRVVQTGSTGSWWSLHEFNVYGSAATSCTGATLSRSGWGASASSTGAGETPGNAIDGNATTRWSTGAAQVNGQWFQLDMLSARTFCKLTIDAGTSTGDYPRGYQVFVSNDGVNWGSAVASGSGTTQLVTTSFAAQTARFVRIVQTGSIGNWWSLHELNVIN